MEGLGGVLEALGGVFEGLEGILKGLGGVLNTKVSQDSVKIGLGTRQEQNPRESPSGLSPPQADGLRSNVRCEARLAAVARLVDLPS